MNLSDLLTILLQVVCGLVILWAIGLLVGTFGPDLLEKVRNRSKKG